TVFIVSDHGARSLEGGFALNDWLIRQGYLVLKEAGPVDSVTNSDRIPLTHEMIDWSRTRAWGEGGYYGRVFLNVAGREPEGIVPRSGIESLLSDLTRKLEDLPDDRGDPMGTVVRRPEDLFTEIKGIPPDLFVYFGDLAWRSIGTIGGDSLYTPGNDIGPDDANHNWDGIFIAAGRGISEEGETASDILDIAPRVLSVLDLPVDH
ncbi:alkaline phosphatase family protein, partial [Gemmatimonadota bacterium]